MNKNKSPNFEQHNDGQENVEKMKIKCFFESVASEKHPNENEDMILTDIKHNVFGILDGMGGHSAGAVASKTACNYILNHLNELSDNKDIDVIKQELHKIIFDANKFVYDTARTKKEYAGMGTTAVILKIYTNSEGKHYALIANIGDSRAYSISDVGKLKQITVDDDILVHHFTDVEERKRIAEKLSNIKSAKDFEKNHQIESLFWQRNKISNALGSFREIKFNIDVVSIEKGDRLLITSDGIHDNLTTDEIQEIVTQSKTSEEVVKNLKEKSIERSKRPTIEEIRAKVDDMSVMVVDIK